MIAKRLELLQVLVPGLRRFAVIVRLDPGLDQKLQEIRSDAQRKRGEALMLEAMTAKAPELAFARLRGESLRGRLCGLRTLGPVKRPRIVTLAADSRLPVICYFDPAERNEVRQEPMGSWTLRWSKPASNPRSQWKTLQGSDSTRP